MLLMLAAVLAVLAWVSGTPRLGVAIATVILLNAVEPGRLRSWTIRRLRPPAAPVRKKPEAHQ
jgi:hypothetical protein